MDLKEDLQFNAYEIAQQAGVLAKEITLSSPNLNTGYKTGDQATINILGVDEVVNIVGIQQQATDGGWATQVKGFGTGYDLLSKSPKKTRSYLSMTSAEYEEFMWDFGSDLGKTIDYLDYVPLIKPTADDYGTGGWKAIAIMRDIVGLLGLGLETNIIDYDVRQFSIQAGTPYINALMDLVRVYEPIVYEVDGVLFVLEGLGMETSYLGGVYNPDEHSSVISQEIVDAVPPEQLAINGVLGQFIPEKYRGYAGNKEPESDVVGHAIKMAFSFYGSPRLESGTVDTPLGGMQYERRVARDIHGNDYFQYYELRYLKEVKWFEEDDYVEDIGRIGEGQSGYYEVWSVLDEQFDIHANIHWMFSHPVETGEVKVKSGTVWVPKEKSESGTSGGPEPPLYMWEWQIAAEATVYGYTGGGRQDTLSTTKYKLYITDYEELMKSYESLTREDSDDYTLGEDVWQWWGIYEWSKRIHVSLSRESYALVTIGQRLVGLKADEATGEPYLVYEALTPSIEVVQAVGHQGNANELRKMTTYAAEGLPEIGDPEERDKVMDSHAESSGVNCCNWDHLDQICELISAYRNKKKVVRQYQLPLQYPVTVGLPVSINDVEVAPGQVISASGADVGMIGSYVISKQAEGPNVTLEMLVKGSIANE